MIKTEKNPFGAGKPRNDVRGTVDRFRVHMLTAQMRFLKRKAEEKGFDNVSQLIAAWADTECKGAPRHESQKRRLFG